MRNNLSLLVPVAALVLGVAGLQVQTSTSNSTQTTKSGSGQASASASGSASGSASASGNAIANGMQGGFAGGGSSGSSNSFGTPAKATHVILFEPGEMPLERPSLKLEQDRMAWMRMLVVEGKLIYWGPWRDREGEMSVIVAKSDEEAQRIADGDPAVKSKALSAEVRPWDVRFSGPGVPLALPARRAGG